jgi:hypothetical protein
MNIESMLPSAGKMSDFNQQMLTSMVKFTEIATEAQRKFATQQVSAMEANLSALNKMANVMSAGDKPTDAYAAQVEAAQALGQDLMGIAKDAWEVQVETRDKVAALLTEGAETARTNAL